jgi:predicted outer membrane repeat protein
MTQPQQSNRLELVRLSRPSVVVAVITTLAVLFSGALAQPTAVVHAKESVFWVGQEGTPRDALKWFPAASCEYPDFFGSDDNVIREAIQLAPTNSIVVLCDGTYDFENTIYVGSKNISLVGLGQEQTRLEGNSNQLFQSSGLLKLSELTIAGGWAGSDGGAIDGNQVFTQHVSFVGNESNENGGAISANIVNAQSTLFLGNVAQDRGGAIYANSVTISQSTVVLNDADWGGAIYASTINISNSSVEANNARWSGGSLYGVTVHATRNEFVENSADYGGAIRMNQGGLTLNAFLENVATDYGGAVISFGNAIARSNRFVGNTSFETSALRFVNASAPAASGLVGNTFIGNSSDLSGVVSFDGARFAVSLVKRMRAANTFKHNFGPSLVCMDGDRNWC